MKYQVDYTDFRTGATSAIDTVIASEDYTASDYLVDCLVNGDPEWIDMLGKGSVELVKIED